MQALNARGESLALATLVPLARVERRQVVATLKAVPLVLGKEEVVDLCRHLAPAVSVTAFKALKAGLIQTRLRGHPGRNPRQDPRGDEGAGGIARRARWWRSCVASTTKRRSRKPFCVLRSGGIDLLLMIGASATVDRLDCVPRGIEGAGGGG